MFGPPHAPSAEEVGAVVEEQEVVPLSRGACACVVDDALPSVSATVAVARVCSEVIEAAHGRVLVGREELAAYCLRREWWWKAGRGGGSPE